MLVLVLVGFVVVDVAAPPRQLRARGSAPAEAPTRTSARRSAAFGSALEFANTYLAFLYGMSPASGVDPVTRAFRLKLLRGRAFGAPAEGQRQVVLRELQLFKGRRGSELAAALVNDGATPPFTLSFNLSSRNRRWVVTGLASGSDGP